MLNNFEENANEKETQMEKMIFKKEGIKKNKTNDDFTTVQLFDIVSMSPQFNLI